MQREFKYSPSHDCHKRLRLRYQNTRAVNSASDPDPDPPDPSTPDSNINVEPKAFPHVIMLAPINQPFQLEFRT